MKKPKLLEHIITKESRLYNRDKFFRSLEYLADIMASAAITYTPYYIILGKYENALSFTIISGLMIVSRITLEQTINEGSYKKKKLPVSFI